MVVKQFKCTLGVKNNQISCQQARQIILLAREEYYMLVIMLSLTMWRKNTTVSSINEVVNINKKLECIQFYAYQIKGDNL